MTKEDILNKQFVNTGRFQINASSDARIYHAMTEYASQQTSELKGENERLKGLIEKAYDYAREHHFTRHPEKIWENFKKENNLSYE